MPTTRFMTTVLPYSVKKGDPFHLSLFFSHRLDGGGQLSAYKPMVNWVKTLANATVTIHTNKSGANPIRRTLLLEKTDETAWDRAFPGTTKVAEYPKPTVTDEKWNSFPAHLMPDYALAVHNVSALCSPVSRPSVLGNALADAVFNALGRIDDAAQVIGELSDGKEGYAVKREDRLADLDRARKRAANATLNPMKPEPEDPSPGPALAPGEAGKPWQSPIELLLAHTHLDKNISEYLDSLGPGIVPDPMLAILRDTRSAYRYYERKELQYEPVPLPTSQVGPERTEHEPPDFHERVAAACNVPALARKLGLVVDVEVHEDDLAFLEQAERIWCDVTLKAADAVDTEKYLSPETFCEAQGERFYALPEDRTRWHVGRMRIGKADRYRVMDLDPDAAGLALEQHLRSSIRALAIAINGDRGSYAPAALRATGFAVAELERSDRLQKQLEKSEELEPVVEIPGMSQQRPSFKFEGLMRGTRVEVWDDFTRKWHSLHERTVTASFKQGASDKPVISEAPDIGHLQNPPLSRKPGDGNPYYVHEVLAGWDGWSLSAPRPGKLVIHNATDDPDPEAERIVTEPEALDGLRVRSTAKRGSLPALRYGRKYSFRIAGVDLAGNSAPMDQTPPTEVNASLIKAAAEHLDNLRAEAAERDKAGLVESLRAVGKLPCYDQGGDGTRADVERATASVVANASSLTMHPQWDVAPELLAQLSADAEEPQTVTSPRKFLRWDPIPAPTLVPRVAYTTGESLQRMVIRTGLSGTPGVCQRHIVPPKGSEQEAEQDGRLDELMQSNNQRRAYAIALKERGNLFHTRIQDLNNPKGTLAQPGVQLLSMPGVTNGETLEKIQDPRYQPAEGQYIVHNVDNMVLAYLPDPMAHGVAFGILRGRRESPIHQSAGAAIGLREVHGHLARTAATSAGTAQRCPPRRAAGRQRHPRRPPGRRASRRQGLHNA